MTRRFAILAGVVVASFALAAGAVAYFADSEETYDVVRAGPPIPWLKVWSQATDPVNVAAPGTLKYATQNNVSPATVAATGKIEGTTATIDARLGKRTPGGSGNNWKPDSEADVHGRFNRLVTVEVPSDAPVPAGQTISLSISQDPADRELSSSYDMFSALELASITAGANTEDAAPFRGTGYASTVQLSPGDKRQVNVQMRTFGQTDSQTDRVVNTKIVLSVTTPDGDVVTYRVPVAICNHVQQCS